MEYSLEWIIRDVHSNVIFYGTFLLALLVFWGLTQMLAEIRTATSVVKQARKVLFASHTTNINAEAVFRAVLEYALQSGYRIDHVDYSERRAILSDRPSPFTWGFFYPLHVYTDCAGRTTTEVGAISKLIHPCHLVLRSRDQCFNGVRTAIWLSENRTSSTDDDKR